MFAHDCNYRNVTSTLDFCKLWHIKLKILTAVISIIYNSKPESKDKIAPLLGCYV